MPIVLDPDNERYMHSIIDNPVFISALAVFFIGIFLFNIFTPWFKLNKQDEAGYRVLVFGDSFACSPVLTDILISNGFKITNFASVGERGETSVSKVYHQLTNIKSTPEKEIILLWSGHNNLSSIEDATTYTTSLDMLVTIMNETGYKDVPIFLPGVMCYTNTYCISREIVSRVHEISLRHPNVYNCIWTAEAKDLHDRFLAEDDFHLNYIGYRYTGSTMISILSTIAGDYGFENPKEEDKP